MISFTVSKEEAKLISQIVRRASKMAGSMKFQYPAMDISMDLTACHCNGCPIDLEQLLNADDFNFSHDIFDIYRHINRKTGQLENCFLPRFATKEIAQ